MRWGRGALALAVLAAPLAAQRMTPLDVLVRDLRRAAPSEREAVLEGIVDLARSGDATDEEAAGALLRALGEDEYWLHALALDRAFDLDRRQTLDKLLASAREIRRRQHDVPAEAVAWLDRYPNPYEFPSFAGGEASAIAQWRAERPVLLAKDYDPGELVDLPFLRRRVATLLLEYDDPGAVAALGNLVEGAYGERAQPIVDALLRRATIEDLVAVVGHVLSLPGVLERLEKEQRAAERDADAELRDRGALDLPSILPKEARAIHARRIDAARMWLVDVNQRVVDLARERGLATPPDAFATRSAWGRWTAEARQSGRLVSIRSLAAREPASVVDDQ